MQTLSGLAVYARPLRRCPALSRSLPVSSCFGRFSSSAAPEVSTPGSRAIATQDSELENEAANALEKEGSSALAKGDFALAVSKFEEALELDKTNINSMYKLSSRWAEANKLIAKAISIFGPMSAELWDAKGVVLCQANEFAKYEEALVCFDRALELSGGLVQTHFNKGVALNGVRRFGPAVMSFDKAIELSPLNAGFDHLKGKALYFLGNEEEAFKWLQDSKIDADPDFKDWFHGLKAFHEGKYDEALQSFRVARFGALVWTDSDLLSYQGECLLAKGDLDGAFDLFKQSYEKNPRELLSLHGMGEVYLKKGDKKAAQECFDTALVKDTIYYKQDYFRVKPLITSSE